MSALASICDTAKSTCKIEVDCSKNRSRSKIDRQTTLTMPDFRNLVLLRLCAYELCRAFDPNLQNYCFLVSCASPCKDNRAASTRADAPTQR